MAELLPAKSIKLDSSECAIILSALELKRASLSRYIRAQVPGTQLHFAYAAEALVVDSLKSKF